MRFHMTIHILQKLAGQEFVGFNNTAFLEERRYSLLKIVQDIKSINWYDK